MPPIDPNHALARMSAAADVQAAVAALRDALGVAHVTWHLMVNAGAPLDNPLVRTTYPAAWVSHYLLNGFARCDPVVTFGLSCAAPFLWSQVPVATDAARVLADARTHGIPVQGLSAPHIDAMGRRSLLSVSAHGDGADLVPLGPVLSLLAPALHARALAEAVAPDAARPHLSPREVECLRWVAQGKSHTEIATILGLSPHTVRGYLRTVREQLDCVSLAQAVTRATQLRLL